MRSMIRFCFALALLHALSSARPTEACSILLLDEYGVAISDTTPQTDLPALSVESWSVDRGCGRNGGSGNCADVGTLELVVGPEAELSADLGVHISVVVGEAPMGQLDGAISIHQGGVMHFPWGDGTGQPAFDFSITVQAIDDQGRVGPLSAPIAISHPGGGTCSLGCDAISDRPSGTALAFILGLLGLGFALRRC